MDLHKKHPILLSMIVVLLMVLSACGTGTTQEPAIVTEADVVEVDATPAAVEEAPVAAETPVVEEPLVEEPDVAVEEDITDTDVITETEETDVVTDTQDVQETGVQTPTVGLAATAPISLTLATDAAGNRFLADQNGQPIFAYIGAETAVTADENFEPLQATENLEVGEGLDPAMFGQVQRNGVNQMTYNDLPLYRFVGTGDPMQLAAQNQFAPLTVEE
ncbi:MAG: hypothetical protein KF893_16225 [Caldilineaceae bacterium]|nr:hypothetical protein [Caldilineaceae bacterium]